MLVRDAGLRARIARLAIPPAWIDVWIAADPNGHIQATGTDAAGRRQYLYHPIWREQKDRIKHSRALSLAASLPTARRRVTIDLRGARPTRERALAVAFRMLDSGSLRVGSERYTELNGSHGLSTLLGAHARVRGAVVELEFPGKSGQEWTSQIRDIELARVIRSLKRRGAHARLLAFRAQSGWQSVAATDINDYVRERTGGDFTAKDFRTLRGTVAAAVSLARQGVRPSRTAREKVIAQTMRDVAAVLGNTPAVARASYVDPRLIDHYRAGRTIDSAHVGSAETQLRALLLG